MANFPAAMAATPCPVPSVQCRAAPCARLQHPSRAPRLLSLAPASGASSHAILSSSSRSARAPAVRAADGEDPGAVATVPTLADVSAKVLDAERSSHWSLVQRFRLVAEVLDQADAVGPEGMALVYTLLRLSSTRVLDWYRNANFQSKDIAHTQKYVAEIMAAKARHAGHPLNRFLARQALAGLPRGGGNGDDIRMEILHIMRGNGIKEGHRPGHDEPFLEQWHQKLHTNTTPDDIVICEAYLAYLHSGNHDDYWRVLWDNGRLTREAMESWPKPIRAWPHHLPHLIPAFQHYLWILKVTHSGADLDTAMEMAKGFMDEDLRWHMFDMLSNRNEWWVPGKIVELRERLSHYWKAPDSSRDLLLLDCALESWLRTSLERADLGSMEAENLAQVVHLVLRNAVITLDGDEDLAQCNALWGRLLSEHGGDAGARWANKEWAQAALAAIERTQLSLAAHCDSVLSLVQPHAQALGEACNLDKVHITNFGEEVVRGLPLSIMAPFLQRLEPTARAAAGGGAWQIVSMASATGEVKAIPSLADVQGSTYDVPTILLADALTGVEDIPPGVVAVLTRSSTDVLSHLSIRARSQKVLLATCFGESEWDAWKAKAGQAVSASVDPTADVVAPKDVAAGEELPTLGAATSAASVGSVKVPKPATTQAWALQEPDFAPGLVGAKALNLSILRKGLPDSIGVPASVSLPFGTFERVLAGSSQNAAVADELKKLQTKALEIAKTGQLPKEQLAQIRQIVSTGLVAPQELVQELGAAAAGQGLISSASKWASAASWSEVWSAVCRVWASKWTDRAWLSRRAVGIVEEDVFMSVLLQAVVPVQYAYVLHTSNPVTGAKGELLGEVVAGMGETLVGNYPGRALGFTAAGKASPEVLALPSKREALYAPAEGTLIARSDANAEDLEQYAAAGLYDSVPLRPLELRTVDYANEPLWWDPTIRGDITKGLAAVGQAAQAVFGGQDQDVEGGWLDGKFYVVQARPQV